MTEHRNLKRAVRARMRKTGENYTTALLNVGPAIPVESSARTTTGVPMIETTAIPLTPAGWDRWTDRARVIAGLHAANVATELGHERVGTEHLLAGFWDEPGNLALQILEPAGLTRDAVIAGIEAKAPRGSGSVSSWTRESFAVLDLCAGIAIGLAHNYVGTEHLLLAIICDEGSIAEAILTGHGLTPLACRRDILTALGPNPAE